MNLEFQLLLHAATGWRVDPDYGHVYGRRGLIGWANRDGYLVAKVSPDRSRRGRKNFFLHRIVWESVHGPIDNSSNRRTINHINGVKADNRLSNLELVSQLENVRHAIETGLTPFRKRHGPISRPPSHRWRAVTAASLDGSRVENYPSISAAARAIGLHKAGIWMCCIGRMNKYKGFRFSYFFCPD